MLSKGSRVLAVITSLLSIGLAAEPASAASSTSGNVAPDEALQLSTSSYVLSGIACTTAANCWAVGSTAPTNPYPEGIVVQINDGIPGTVTLVPGTGKLSGISCFSWNLGEVCNAVGTAPYGSSGVLVPMDVSPANPYAPEFFGPNAADTVSGTSNLVSISCPSSSACEAVGTNGSSSSGSNGVIVPIANMDPANGNLPLAGTPIEEAGTTSLSGVSCPTDNNCVVVGVAGPDDIVIPVTKGVVGNVESVTPGGAFTGVGCTSTTTCYAVDAGPDLNGEVVPIKNGRPGTPVIDASVSFQAVACISSTTMCTAVGIGSIPTGVNGAVAVPIDNGVPGVAIPVPNDFQPSANGAAPGPTVLNGVACPSSTQCFSVGNAVTQADRYSEPVFSSWLDTIQVTLPSQ